MKNSMYDSVRKAVKYWWVSLITGILAIVLGIWCLTAPDGTLTAMTWLFILVFIVNGIVEIAFSISNRNVLRGWGWTLASGIVDLLFAALLIILPNVFVAAVIVYLVGFWMLFRGIWGIGESAELQTLGVRGWGWTLAGAIFTIIFAFLFLLSPALFKGIFVVALISVSLLIYGVFRIYIGFQLRSVGKDMKEVE